MTVSIPQRDSVPLDRAVAPIHATLATAPERPHPHRLPHLLDQDRTHPPSDASSLLDGFLCGPEPDDVAEQERVLAGIEARLFGNAASVTLSRYVLLRRLGEGSHGVVYEGYDPELDRKVAIKLVRTHGLREAYRQRARMRLLREAQAMAHVSHPNVITVHDLGTYDAVQPDDARGAGNGDGSGRTRGVFLVMELLEGGTLADWFQAGPHPWRAVLDVFIAAGRGLAAAHGIGLIHRDFKPANVLLGMNGRVCVSDFGLARASAVAAAVDENVTFSRDSVVSISLTHTGLALGTPAHMAPEQHAGAPCDVRSDQYSFCLALYEALQGRRPFPQSDFDALSQAKRTGAPTPRGRHVPAWLHRLVLRGLHPDPDRRHPSMSVLVEALERGRVRRSRRTGVLTAAVVGLAVLLGATRTPPGTSCDAAARSLDGIWDPPVQRQVQAAFAASTRAHAVPTWRTVSSALDRYAADWLAARVAACEVEADVPADTAEQQRHCLARRHERLAQVTTLLRQADDGIIEHALDLIGALPDIAPCSDSRTVALDGVDMLAPGPLRSQIDAVARDIARAEILWRAGKHDPARAVIDAAAARSRALVHGAMTAEALRIQALLAQAAGDTRTAESHLRDAVRLSESAGAHAQAAKALIELAGVLSLEPAHRTAMTLSGALESSPERATEAVHLADMAQARIDYLDLGEHQRARLALYRSLAGQRTGESAGELAGELAGKLERPAASLRAAIERYGQANPDPVLLGQMYVRLGVLFLARNESHAAEAAWQRATDVYRGAYGPGHPRLAEPLSYLAAAAAARRNHALALTRYHEALAASTASLQPEDAGAIRIQAGLTATLVQLGRFQEALLSAQHEIDLRERVHGPDHASTAGVHLVLGKLLLDLERPSDAIPHLAHAIRLWEAELGPDAPPLAEPVRHLGFALLHSGRPDSAVPHFERALALCAVHDGSFSTLAELYFGLAQALWPGDRARARAEAARARALLAPEDLHHDLQRAIETWINAHR